MRRQAALHYLASSEHSIEDIAFLLGFSEASAFVRAFKRWQGMAPMSFASIVWWTLLILLITLVKGAAKYGSRYWVTGASRQPPAATCAC